MYSKVIVVSLITKSLCAERERDEQRESLKDFNHNYKHLSPVITHKHTHYFHCSMAENKWKMILGM